MSYDYAFKFILVGDTAVGKTSILSRFLNGTFNRQNDITIGVEFGERTTTVNGQAIKLQVWDTAGQEDFRSMTRQYYRSAAAALLVYDCTRPETFKNISRWADDVRTNGNRSVILVLICNKIDMVERRVVSRNDGLKLAKEHDMLYVETSAKSNQNIEEAFLRPTVSILDRIDTGIIKVGGEENGIKIDPAKRRTLAQQKESKCCEC